MVIEDILERNRAFVRGRSPQALPADDRVALAVIACHDPRLDGLLAEALGLAPGTAVVLRTAGAHVSREGDPLRSLAVAAYRYGIREVLVVGHTSCRMASFDTSGFVDAFRARGVPREAFGAEDLRAWAGAAADPRRGAVASASAILGAAFLPKDLRVAAGVLDDGTGALEIVWKSGDPLPGFELIGTTETARPLPAPAPAPQARAAVATASGEAPSAPAPARDAVDAALSLVGKVVSKARLRDDAMRLRLELGATRNPIEKLRLVETFLRRAGGDAQEVRVAVEELRRQAVGTPPAAIAEEVARRVTDLARED